MYVHRITESVTAIPDVITSSLLLSFESADQDQTAPRESVCSRSMRFACEN